MPTFDKQFNQMIWMEFELWNNQPTVWRQFSNTFKYLEVIVEHIYVGKALTKIWLKYTKKWMSYEANM